MNVCIPFMGVPNIAETIAWYESIGFTCTSTNLKLNPGDELSWAELEYKGALIMLSYYPFPLNQPVKYLGLYFSFDTLDGMYEKLQGKAEIIEVLDNTVYGRKEIVFKDLNGFQVIFSSEPDA